MKRSNPPFAHTFAALALFCAAGSAWPQTSTSTTTGMSSATQLGSITPAPATASTPTSKLVSTFTPLAGSQENAASLVNGLRSSTVITLTNTTEGAPSGKLVTFTAPTKPMGYGNIRIAMSLAEAQLASQGITNPTPTQLQGALMGTTTTQGVLQMRASGMGWGQIANSMGFKLGPVMSGKQTFTSATAASGTTTTATGTTATGASAEHGKSSVTTAAGTTTTGHGKSGITTAGGGSVNAGGVSAAGGKVGASAQGLSHGKGGGKP